MSHLPPPVLPLEYGSPASDPVEPIIPVVGWAIAGWALVSMLPEFIFPVMALYIMRRPALRRLFNR